MIPLNNHDYCELCYKETGKYIQADYNATQQTLVYNKPFLDSNGQRHTHDSNQISERVSCPNGHKYILTSYRKCSICNWQHSSTTIKEL